MSIRMIGSAFMGAAAAAGAAGKSAISRIQGRRGFAVTNGRVTVARSLQQAGAIRIKGGDGIQCDPEIGSIDLDALYCSGRVLTNGNAQQFVVLPEVGEVDILEVQCFNPLGMTAPGLAALRGGFYTSPPKADGTPYPDTVIVDVQQAYAGLQAGKRIFLPNVVREWREPIDVWWIPGTKSGVTAFSFDFRMRGLCMFQQQSADVAWRPSD